MAKINPWWYVPAVGFVAYAVGRALRGGTIGAHPYPQASPHGVPFAEGGNPIWPIAPSSHNSRKYTVSYKDTQGKWHGAAARSFKWGRGSRYHVGMDLYANPGDVVLAPEDGVVVGKQTFLLGTGAMLIRLDSGITVLLGETEMGAADRLGVHVGSRVVRGQPVTRVGLNDAGTYMLHLETYACCPTQNIRWYKGRPTPVVIRDPTDWLLRAKAHSVAVA